MRDAIVIGAGIIGATVAKALRLHMSNVLVVDSDKGLSGTKPSGGHLKPSWFGGMKKEDYDPAMELLADLWGIQEEQFSVYTLGVGIAKATVFRVDTDKVKAAYKTGLVVAIDNLEARPVVTIAPPKGPNYKEECKLLVVATGVWAHELVDVDGVMQAKQGVSFRMKGKLPKPFIVPWAPYKQIVAHQQTDNEIWIGDGTAIIKKNWTSLRLETCLSRCNGALGRRLAVYRDNPPDPIEVRQGLRAYIEHDKSMPCYFKQLGPNAFVATGAGKSGTIAAGFCANKLLQHIGAI